MKLLDEKGLTTVWAAIKNTFTSKSDADGKYAKKSEAATHTSAGVMTPSDKIKLDGIAENANNYSLPLAATSTRGGIQLGYSQNGRNYPVQLSGEKAYVNVPWTDTNTTYDLSSYSQKDETVKNISNSILGTSLSGYKQILTIDYANGTNKNVEISNASGGLDGFMSASDKNKLDNIAAGANNYTLPTASANTLGGVKIGNTPEYKSDWPIIIDKEGKLYARAQGLNRGETNMIESLYLRNPSYSKFTSYELEKISNGVSSNMHEFTFPSKSGTFALTSDIPNVSDLCKINFVDRPSNCVEGRINMFTTTNRSISLNNIEDYGEGLILLLGCYSESQYTIYCTDSDLYYRDVLINSGSIEDIDKNGMYLVTIKGTSVYVYPLN